MTSNNSKTFSLSSFKSKAYKVKSSYLEGTASIKPKPISVKTPPRTTSLKFRTILLSSTPPSPLKSMFPEASQQHFRHSDSASKDSEDFEEIDLNAATTHESGISIDDDCGSTMTRSSSGTSSSTSISSNSTCSGSSSPVTEVDAHIIDTLLSNAHLVQRNPLSCKSSLQEGCASILLHNNNDDVTANRNHQTITVIDDGKEELLHHGIPVKEIPATLAPMIIPSAAHTPPSHYHPPLDRHATKVGMTQAAFNTTTSSMSTISLQRPEFARIYY